MNQIDIFDYGDFRNYLEAVFRGRLSRNANYSHRAFSRDLGLRPQTMNDIFSRRYGFSHRLAISVADRLGLVGNAKDYFINLVDQEHGRSLALREAAAQRLHAIKECELRSHALREPQFSLLTRWSTPAVLELVSQNRTLSVREISRRLKIPLNEAEQALETLHAIGLLKREHDGSLIRGHRHNAANSPTPQPTIRSFHKQILTKADEALTSQTNETRKTLSSVFSCDSAKIQEAKQELANFQAKFLKKYASAEVNDSVYALAVNLFRLDEE